ncbi:MAG: MFS transporter [Actinobacteria bacterium]|nr:MAG: MFS transporter [Actinomycetota bacterium]
MAEAPPPETVPRLARTRAMVRGLAVDLTPLRQSRDYRLLWTGELVSTMGRQITVVALPFQVYLQTRSPLAVGLIGLVEVAPLIVSTIAGGAIADRRDRRTLILVTEFGLAATSALLLVGVLRGFGVNTPSRSAAVPNLVSRDQLPAALALNQVLFNSSMIVGPSVAGLILGAFANPRMGLAWAYGTDIATFAVAIGAVVRMRPLPPKRDAAEARAATGLKEIQEGFSYLRTQRVLISTFLVDLDAMIFGMPRALFPVLALTVFGVGPRGLGFLYAAPAAGALLGAVTAGWVGRVKHQGRAVVWAVALWGAAITGFGLSGQLFGLALLFLAFAGAADVISAVFRGAILQLNVPDSLRGRLSAVHIMVVTGGPRVGDFEAGAVAALVSPWFSVVSGGVVCVAGVLVLARLFPELWRYHASTTLPDDGPPGG